MKVEVSITADARLAIDRYTAAAVELELCGDARPRQLEECRSYAVEALRALLGANPEAFDFVRQIEAARARKAGSR